MRSLLFFFFTVITLVTAGVIPRADDAPDPHRVPPREGLLRDVRKDHPAHLVRELEAPGAHEWDQQRGVQDGGILERGRAQPEDLGRDGHGKGQQE